MKNAGEKLNKKFIRIGEAIIIVIVGIAIALSSYIYQKNEYQADPEVIRTMEYSQVNTEDKKVSNTNYVQFDAFFLRDLNGDGYAEGVRGMCRTVGESDTLYMELNVLDNGSLKDAEITVNSQNFSLQTAIIKDSDIAQNYISNNTTEIRFNALENGTQKLLMGIVKEGGKIGNDTKKYSMQNSVTLTGTHVADDGTETKIEKTVEFKIDWHGTVQTEVYANASGRAASIQEDLPNLSDILTDKGLELSFNIEPVETANQLILKKSYVEGIMPELNGYLPKALEFTDGSAKFTYDKNTGKFTIEKEAQLNENKVVVKTATSYTGGVRYNKYKLKAIYPAEAYSEDFQYSIELKIPVKAYHEGYNNTNAEFTNPYKSNEAQTTIVKTWKQTTGEIYQFGVSIGGLSQGKEWYGEISKEKLYRIYQGISEKEEDDTYFTRWWVTTNKKIDKITLKEGDNTADKFIKKDSTEETMENVTTNIGIYFVNAEKLLGADGWIKVYDDKTNKLLETFNKDSWSKYSKTSPYYYENSVKHIRVETSQTKEGGELAVFNVKELDDEYITTHYTLEQVENLQHIKTHLKGEVKDSTIGDAAVTYSQTAEYKAPVSIANISVSDPTLTTQETVNRKITISTTASGLSHQKWINGSFLVKLPENMILAEVNSVTSNNNTVKVTGYDVYEEAGNYYIKILTENEVEAVYSLTIDCNLTPDPRGITETKTVELYASNEKANGYSNAVEDKYDVNDNLNTKEKVQYSIASLSFIAPNSLVTNQIGSHFDNKGSTVIAPQIAAIEKTQRTAKINVNIVNNYASTVSEIAVLGKIPFRGNTATITGRDLGSTYTSIMKNSGIQVPTELATYASVYYSEKENPSKDILDNNNGWKRANSVTDWSKIKTYLIDLGNYSMPKGKTHTFIYEIQVPAGLEYNDIAYSSHAVYFSLDTENGKYRTSTEPNKLGFMVTKKFDLEITKYQEKTQKLLPGVTYMVAEEGIEDSKIRVTSIDGKLTIKGLYVGKTYAIKEVKAPADYELKEEVVKFKTTADAADNVQVQLVSGTTRTMDMAKSGEDWKLQIALDNAAKAKLKITKKDQAGNALRNIEFKLNGKDKENNFLTTNNNGEINTRGICLNQTYTLTETTATGYYLISDISFRITSTETGFHMEILSGAENLTNQSVTVQDNIPTINLEIPNEKIPTYDLEILKVKKDDEANTKLEGAQFKLEGEGISRPQYFMTDANGKISIAGLYQYVEGKNLEAKYTLTEVMAPEGYATDNTPIIFKAQVVDGKLQLQKESGNIKTSTVEGNKITVTIENSPIFSLTKYTKNGAEKVYLPNAKFKVYAVDEDRNATPAVDVKGNVVGDIKTDANGNISLNLPQGGYKVVEVEAPGGYELPEKEEDRTYYFAVGITLPATRDTSVLWAKLTGKKEYRDYINTVLQTSDGGYLAGGYAVDIELKGWTTNQYDGILIKYDNKGNVQWEKIIAGPKHDEIVTLLQTSDGGYIIGGNFSQSVDWGNGVSISKNGIVKFSSKGEAEWSLEPVNEKGDSIKIQQVIETKNGDYIIAGSLYSNSSDGKAVMLKYNSKGEEQWVRIKTVGMGTNFKKMIATSDGGSIGVIGEFGRDIELENGVTLTAGNQNIIKYNSEGEAQWAKAVGKYTDLIIEVSNGEYILAGYFYNEIDLGNGVTLQNSSGIIAKYNNSGEAQWAKAMDQYIMTMIETSDGGYIALGSGKIIKYNSEWEAQWVKESTIIFRSIIELSDECYVVGGYLGDWKEDLGNGIILTPDNEDGVIIKMEYKETAAEVPPSQFIEVENTIKQYNIKTEIAANSSGARTGGTITGIYNTNYPEANNIRYVETVDHGKNATQNIVITPSAGYVVKEVTLNGEHIEFTPDASGKVVLPKLENVTEDKHYVVVFDNDVGQIVVHHYIDGTTTKVADDEVSENSIGEAYTTSPKVDLEKYELKKLENGEYQIPENATGIYQNKVQEIIYYYVKKQIPLTVHHYIEGTNEQVPLANGGRAQDETRMGEENEAYTTNPVTEANLSSQYELVEIPDNARGTYTYDEVVVTYYYKLKRVKVTTKVETHKETNELGEEVEVTGGSILGKDETPYETVIYSENSVKDIIATPEPGYKVSKITVNGEEIRFTENADKTVTLDKFVNMTEDKEVVVIFERIPAKVIVHHYIAGTTTKVPSKTEGEVVQDEQRTGVVGDMYATSKSDKVASNYICIEEVPNQASGNMTEETIEVTYYYVLNAGEVENTIEKTATEKITSAIDPVTYNIKYNVAIREYIGDATLTIVDTLPYKIDEKASNLNEGIYNDENQTITWTIDLGNINTLENGDKTINVAKQIVVVYKDLDASADKMVNHVKGTITFTQLDKDNEVEDEAETLIDIKGKVIVKHVDIQTNEEIKYVEDGQEKTYGYEYEEKVGADYATNKENIEGYDYVRDTENVTGKVIEGTTEVIYYYKQRELKVLTAVKKHKEVNEAGVEIEVAGGSILGQDEDPYETVIYGKNSTKDIIATPEEGYRVSKITVNGAEIEFTENEDKTVSLDKFINMKEDKVVVVSFERIGAKVIVHHYIEGTNMQVPSKEGGRVADEQIEGYVTKPYTTSKSNKAAANYRCVEETPAKASGNMTEETIEVIYYYALKNETIENAIAKLAVADKVENDVPVLTKEDGEVQYTIAHRVRIIDYIGKAKISIVDTLPAKIDLTNSDLADGNYNESKNTITWEIMLNNIDTYTNGIFDETITKNIKLVYQDQDVTKALVNKVVGEVTTYYPESYTPKPGEEKGTLTKEAQATVEQEYKVEKIVEKVWDDNNNVKGNRPQGIKMQLTANGATKWEETALEQVVLSNTNNWTYTFRNLPKYDNKGKVIEYSVKESEVNAKDLEYYEEAQITKTEDKIIVTNPYKLVDTKMDSKITKTATEKITASTDPVTYNIKYHATITDYIGEATLTITDELPYRIDSVNSNLNEGIYNEDTKTITWQINLGHINTFETGNKEVQIEKQVVVIYQDLDASKDRMTNKVKGKLEFTQTDKKNEVEDEAETLIDIIGKVVVKYVDIDTNEEITYEKDGEAKTYGYEFKEKVGTEYETEKKDIRTYNFVRDSGNVEGKVEEGVTEVIYYYKRKPKGKVIVKYVDEEGNEIVPGGEKEDYVDEKYKTIQKEIENYDFVEVTGEPEGEIIEGITEVIYHYKKVPTDLVVRYLEKDTNIQLLEEEYSEGYMGDEYTTERKEVKNYRAAEPEPQNATGKLVRETTYVTYYYEKIPSGKVVVKYVDIDTNEEIIDKTQEKPYGYELSGYVGEEYKTEEKNIPYYEYIKEKEPANKNGIYTEENDEIIYYYRKLPFNFSIDKTIKEITVDGEKIGNKTGRDVLKVEVVGSEIEKTEVVVKYSIVVKNTGKIDGTAEILEKIPEGYKVDSKETKDWKKTKDGNLATTVKLKAGEEKQLEVVLRWKKGDKNLGQMTNTAEITKTTNLAGYEETTLTDNKSQAEVLMSVKTGIGKNVIVTALVATIAVGMLAVYQIILLKDLKKKE